MSRLQVSESIPGPEAFLPPRAASWYAVHTRSRHEKIAETELAGKGLNAFLPTVRLTRRWSDRNKILDLPLFPGYVFVQAELSVEARRKVLQTHGVVNLVGIGAKASPIPDKQIEDLQTLLAQNIPLAPHYSIHVGQRVRVRGGCFDGVEGILVKSERKRDLVICIEPIQRSVRVSVTDYEIEPA